MKAIIIGGGIAGLACALALTRGGWQVEVLERAPAFTEAGAGLSLWSNALRALDALGVGGPVRGRATLAGQGACPALEDAVVLGAVMASGAGLVGYDRQRRPRTQMIARRSHRLGAAAQWASPAAVHLRDAARRLLPAHPCPLAGPVLNWAA